MVSPLLVAQGEQLAHLVRVIDSVLEGFGKELR